jgi:hypothetical protein
MLIARLCGSDASRSVAYSTVSAQRIPAACHRINAATVPVKHIGSYYSPEFQDV